MSSIKKDMVSQFRKRSQPNKKDWVKLLTLIIMVKNARPTKAKVLFKKLLAVIEEHQNG